MHQSSPVPTTVSPLQTMRRTKIFTVLLIVVGFFVSALSAHAATYYVDATGGNDANLGTSTTSAWQTLTKVNSKTFVAGDNILFKKGDTFYGALTMKQSGTSASPITLGAYGTGSKPVISGLTTVSGWTAVGGGVYKVSIPNGTAAMNLVTLNGAPQTVGRYPNADATNGGYLTYESSVGTSSITDTSLTGAIDWNGAQVVIRKNEWTIDKGIINAPTTGTTISYTGAADGLPGYNNYGYFIQRDLKTLDQLGEWYFNPTTKDFYMYFGSASPSSYTVKVSTVDRLFNFGKVNSTDYIAKYVVVDGLAFEGANISAVHSQDGSNITVKNSDFTNMGSYGIYIWNSPYILIDSVTTNNILSNAIIVRNNAVGHIVIKNSNIQNTGLLNGMGVTGTGSFKAVSASVSKSDTDTVRGVGDILIQNNVVEHSGFCGITFDGSDATVEKNVVNDYDIHKQDGGGIYMWTNYVGVTYSNRVIQDNIVMNGVGAPQGTSGSTYGASAIYLDGVTMGVKVLRNTIINTPENAIQTNDPKDVIIEDNTVYNSGYGVSFTKWQPGTGIHTIRNLQINRNIFYNTQKKVFLNIGDFSVADTTFATYQNEVRAYGAMDGNYYNTWINELGFNTVPYSYVNSVQAPIKSPVMSLEGWQAFSGFDATAKKIPSPALYTVTATNTANLFTNGQFNTTISGLTTQTTNAWDGTSQITGVGSLKVTAATPAISKYATVTGGIGNVTAGKKYLLRFKTKGSTELGNLQVYIRNAAYTPISSKQSVGFGTAIKSHEFLITDQTSDVGSFVIYINDFSGTTYVDDIEFYEVNATVSDPASSVRFEYNRTTSPLTIPLSGSYVDAKNIPYSGSITLAPFTSAVLIKPAPPAPDTTAPTVALTAPVTGTVTGTVTLTATAADNMAVSKVDFYYGTTLISSSTAAPYSAIWNTLALANGTYVLKAVATDSSNNVATSSLVSVTVNNPDITAPIVSLTAPVAGTVITGTVVLAATATDNIGVTKVDFYQGSTLITSDMVAPYTATWNTLLSPNGPYTLKAIAYDAANNATTSALVSVTLNNPDITAPTVVMTAPISGTISGTITLSANASDNIAVTKVDFYQGSTLITSDTSAPYSTTWNTLLSTNGAYTVKATAYDAAGNNTTSTPVSVTVNNADITAPTVSLTAPGASATLSGTATLSATAVDNVGVSRVDFYYDAILIASTTASPYTTPWLTTGAANGVHTLKAIAYDAANNQTTSALVSVTVSNVTADITTPTVSITTPSASTTLSGTATISANATDNIGVSRVDFYYGTTLIASDTASAYTTPWVTTAVANGTYVLKAIAYDAANNATTSSSVSVTVNNTVVPGQQIVAISSPLNNATVSGTVAITATVTGTPVVSKVDFYKDNDTVPFATLASSYTTFFDTKTLSNTAHTFRAVATNTDTSTTSSGTISLTISNGAVITPPTTSTPGPSSNVVAMPGDKKASLTWTPPTSTGGSAITSYSINSVPAAGFLTTTTPSATFLGLTNGVAYTFSVRANNSAGASTSWVPSNTITPSATFTIGRTVLVKVTTSLTVRQTPAGTKIGTVLNGATGTVLQNGSGWTKVQFLGVTGWVSSAYLYQTN